MADMYSSLKRRRSSASAASSLPNKSPPTFDSAAVAAAQQLPHSAPFSSAASSPARPPKKIKKTGSPRIRLRVGGGGGASKKKKQQQQQLDDDDDGRSSSISAAAAPPAKDDLQDSDDDEEMEFGGDDMELDGDDSRKPSAKRRPNNNDHAAAVEQQLGEEEEQQQAAAAAAAKPSKKKKKTNKRKSTTIKKQELLEQEKNRILLEGIQEAKENFERHRDEILAEIPAAYKNAFGHIGFSRWSKFHQPVLVLSPFDVPAEPVRGQWLEMFEKVKKHDRQDSASWLIYWYGASDPGTYYSLIPPKQKFMTYETAKKKGLHVLPAPVQKKIDENKKLSKADKEIVKAFQEMEEDLEKEPSERKRGVLNFQENYELLSLADVDGIVFDESAEMNLEDSDDDSELVDSTAPAKPKAKKKKATKAKKSKKTKSTAPASEEVNDGGNVGHDDVRGLDLEDSDDVPAAKPKAKKKKAKKKKVGKAAKPADDIQMDAPPADGEVPAAAVAEASATIEGSGMAPAGEAPANFAPSQEVGDIDDIGDAESSGSEDDEKDDDYVDPDAPNLQDFDDDAALLQPESKQGGAKKTKKKSSKDEAAPKKKRGRKPKAKQPEGEEEAGADSTKKAKAKPAKKSKPITEKSQKAKERKAFRRCEEQYCPLLTQWKEALASSDVKSVKAALAQVLKEVDNFAATFIETYGLSQTIKESKALLKNVEGGAQLVHEVRNAFKASYMAKKDLLPAGFKIPKSTDDAKKKPVAKSESKKGDKSTAQGDADAEGAKKDSERDQARTNGRSDAPSQPENQSVAIKAEKASSTSQVEKESGGATKVEKQSSAPKPDVAHDPVQPKVELAVPRRGDSRGSPVQKAKEARKPASLPQTSAPERKQPKFSLTRLMGQSKRDSGQGMGTSESSKRVIANAPQSAPRSASKLKPGWMTEPVKPGEALSHDQRLLALEFLSDMALQFPSEGLNREAIARSIEAEVFKLATSLKSGFSSGSEERWLDPYWKKVHAIIAGVSGKSQPGSLFQDLLSGKYGTAAELVNLPNEKLAEAFEADV